MTGQVLDGRYRLVERLGSGGMGEVWRGHDERLGRTVAIKLIHPGASVDDEAVALFRREAQVTARLAGHPNIVILYDYGTDGDTVYTVMELVTGCSLSALLRERGRLPVELAVRWGAHVCAGLAAAHAVGVVHRDIKPSNLMVVDADAPDGGTVKLVDFGIAGFHEAALHQRTLPPTGEPFGTPLYVSPEQIQMLPVGAFSDLYSFGAVLFHMLTGQPPFHAAEPMPVLRMHLTEPPPNPAELRPDVPAELAELVLMLLAKDPGQRPDNALWVRDRLLSLSGTSPPASAASPTESASREAQMRRLEQSWVEAERLAAAGQAAAAAQRIGALLGELAAIYGADHPATLEARRRHASLTSRAGDPERAAALFDTLVADLDRIYGHAHPETYAARHHLAAATEQAGRRAEAAVLRSELVDALTAQYGPQAARLLHPRLFYAVDLAEAGDFTGAEKLLRDLAAALKQQLGAHTPALQIVHHYLDVAAAFASETAGAEPPHPNRFRESTRLDGRPPPHPLRQRLTRWLRSTTEL